MTREEAIEKLKQTVGLYLLSGNADNTYCKEWREILEALEQEPKICEKCLYAEETDGSHCYECVKGESKFEPQKEEVMKIGDVYYEKHTVTEISHRNNTVSETQVERVDTIPQKWIPISEKLPEDGIYLVTIKTIMLDKPTVQIKSFAEDLYEVDEFDFRDKKGQCGWYDYDGETGYWEDDRVIAWMPLPEPYKQQESGG